MGHRRFKCLCVILSLWVTVLCPFNFSLAMAQSMVTATVHFRAISAASEKPIQGARIILIGNGGQILETGVTDANGNWTTAITVNQDERFKDVKMGTVTAIGLANGHNEEVVYGVPVVEGQVQPITLNPFEPGKRNEPSSYLGNLNHIYQMGLVDKYATKVGLRRQSRIRTADGYAPWSPVKGGTQG